LFAFPAVADGFHLVCEAKKGVGYRLDTMPDGKVLVDEWNEEGAFNSKWNFRYSGSGDLMQVDDKDSLMFYVNDSIIVTEYAQNGSAQSLWSYAINLVNMKAVASQVNVANVMGQSLKARSISLSCAVQ
tara:strand:- start:601 stop:987 length:387 start_codon:yes stop_codon:yes gene_type:complete